MKFKIEFIRSNNLFTEHIFTKNVQSMTKLFAYRHNPKKNSTQNIQLTDKRLQNKI